MNYMLLVNVLEYFDRENLEKLSIVSRQFEKIVRIEFPRHPFRVFQELSIETGTNGNIYLGMENNDTTLKSTTNPNIAEFKADLTDAIDCHALLRFPLRAVQPFLGKSVRFEKTIIEVNSTLINQQSISAMENFAHLWTGRTLEIKQGYEVLPAYDDDGEPYGRCAPKKDIIPSYDRIFNSPGVITPCRNLQIYRIDAPLTYPTFYAVDSVMITEMYGFPGNLLNFVEGLLKHNSRTLLICFSRIDFQREHIEIIRKAFSKAKVAHTWKLILGDRQFSSGEKLIEFRDKNLLTKDVLELRMADNQLKSDMLTSRGIICFHLWILERKSL